MTNIKKYSYRIEQVDGKWAAKILRRASSKKTVVAKHKTSFDTQEQAESWAQASLDEFSTTLVSSNQRHGEHRKAVEEQRRLRSARRADKTLKAKQEILKMESSNSELEPGSNIPDNQKVDSNFVDK